jgi:hypothetical protein
MMMEIGHTMYKFKRDLEKNKDGTLYSEQIKDGKSSKSRSKRIRRKQVE